MAHPERPRRAQIVLRQTAVKPERVKQLTALMFTPALLATLIAFAIMVLVVAAVISSRP
jgi:hypothetical protein